MEREGEGARGRRGEEARVAEILGVLCGKVDFRKGFESLPVAYGKGDGIYDNI